MTASKYVLGAAVFLLIAVLMAPGALADTRSLDPGASFSVDYSADFGDRINYTWHTQQTGDLVRFVILEPSGDEIANLTQSSWDNQIFVLDDGTYTFTWTNVESNEVTVIYTVNVWDIGVPDVGEALDAVVLGMIIAVIVIVVVIALIIVFVVMGDKRKQTQQPVYGPQGTAPGYQPAAAPPSMCPTCGSPVDPQASFCSRCGARFR